MLQASSVWGNLPTWVLVAMALATAWKLGGRGGGVATSELERQRDVLAESLKAERDDHQRTRDNMGAEIRDLRVEVANLRGRTDVALAINAWGEQHEQRAAERHAGLLNVLELIARRLGADE